MIGPKRISRRTALRGLGTTMALPLLDAMLPIGALAGNADSIPSPKRMAFFYVPNGVHLPDWTPAAEGAEFELPWILEPLAPVKQKLLVLSGLTHAKGRANGDGAGDHARALASFLTGCQPVKTSGANIQVGISVDQVAAQRIGDQTRFPSLEFGVEQGALAGSCDSGYSCAYSSNLSWRSPSTPVPKEIHPRLIFDRLFSEAGSAVSDQARAKRNRLRRSVLDLVMEDAGRLRKTIGTNDQRKIDEYLTSTRELEIRLGKTEYTAAADRPDFPRPGDVPKDFAEHVNLVLDLLVLAFQTDLSRIATFSFANEGSNRAYRQLEVPEGHHDLSHHGNDAAKQEKIRRINRFHVTLLGRFLEKLEAVREGEGTLLDNSMIVYGSGLGDGNRHNHEDLPILLAGQGGGILRSGRHVRYPTETPLCNLFLSMLDWMGAETTAHGDSTGKLSGLARTA